MWTAKLISLHENGSVKPAKFQQIFVRLLTIRDIRIAKAGCDEVHLFSSLLVFKNPLARAWFKLTQRKLYLRLIEYAISKSSRASGPGDAKKMLSVEVNQEYQASKAIEVLLRKNGFQTEDLLNLSPIERENMLSAIGYISDKKNKMRFKPISHTIRFGGKNG